MIKGLLDRALALYQLLVSPVLGNHCRFIPTCSSYARQAIATYGTVRGLGLALQRLGRCHPFCHGGLDPIPERRRDGRA